MTLAMDSVKQRLPNQGEAFDMLDASGSGTLILSDFAHFFAAQQLIIYQDELVALFKRIDTKQDGIIDRDEMYHFLDTPKCEQKREFVGSSKRFTKPRIALNDKPTIVKQDKKYFDYKTKLRAEANRLRTRQQQKPNKVNETART